MGCPAAIVVAGVGRRIAAFLVDSLLVGVADVLLTVLFNSVFGPLVAATRDGAALLAVAVNPLRVVLELTATLLVDAVYFAGCWTRWGATPAQLVLGLRLRLAAGMPAGRRGGIAAMVLNPRLRTWV
jgi:uncharacterized RDD family membrane protein YckC